MRLFSILLSVLLAACSPTDDRPSRENEDGSRSKGSKTWESLPPAPTERTEVTAAVFHGSIYVIGGYLGDGSTTGLVEVFDLETRRWRKGQDLPIAVNHAMTASDGKGLYVVGGSSTAGISRKAFVFDGERWQEEPSMPEGRSAGGAASDGRRLLVVGGVGPNGVATTTFAMDLGSKKWTTIEGLPSPREHLGVAATKEATYAVGGRSPGNLTNVDRLGPEGKWTPAPPLPRPRGGLGATATDSGAVIAAGGESPEGTFADVDVLLPGAQQWKALPPLRHPRHGLGVVFHSGRVYVICGGPAPGLTVSNVIEALDIQDLG